MKNAFDTEMIHEITDFFNMINNDENIQGIIIRGEGTAFCAGADLKWMKSMAGYTFEENMMDSRRLWNMFEAIKKCRHVLIAQVHGAVFGGGLGILACCDYVIAEEKTKFCFSEVKLGLAPAVISSFILKKCADAFVRPLMLSGEVFTTESAIKTGLAHAQYSENLNIEDIIKKFADNGAEGMRETKKLLNSLPIHHEEKEHIKLTTETISQLRVSEDAQARLKKFLQK